MSRIQTVFSIPLPTCNQIHEKKEFTIIGLDFSRTFMWSNGEVLLWGNPMAELIPTEKRTFDRQYEESAIIDASPEEVFAVVDDHAALSAHMAEPSLMMGGGRMETSVDEGGGQKVGSHIRMKGKAFGLSLFLDEVVTEYEPPYRKVWETVGDLRLLVIGHYRWSNIIELRGGRSLLRVSFEYDLPSSNAWLGRLLGGMYAKWCVRQMITTARDNTNASGKPS